MALVLADRVQETGTANTTVSFTLTGAVSGFQSFATIGNTNTTYYAATDAFGNWEAGLGTYSTTGPTLTRTTVYSSSNSNLAVTFSGAVNVFVTYPSSRSVYEDASGNVSPLGTIASGTWQGTTIGVAYGGTGVTASSGANSVVLRDANQNITVNRLNQSSTTVTAAGATTTLTAASTFSQILNGTGGQTFKLPDATTLTNTTTFEFNNNATGTLTIQNNAGTTVGTVASGGAANIALLSNATVGGTWDVHAFIPENVTWGTDALALGATVITGGTWNGGTITSAYGGTGLTTFTGANNALYSTSASALAAGTLPTAAGGTGLTTFTGANRALYSTSASAITAGTLPTAAGGTGLTTFTGANNALYSTSASAITAGTLPVAAGGTGLTTFTTANNALYSSGATSLTAGTLPISAGGTNATSFTTYGILYYNPGFFSVTSSSSFTFNGNILDVTGTIRSASQTTTGAAGGSIAPTSGSTNQYTITALGAAATIDTPTGTPIDGQKLIVRIKDNGTARSLSWTTTSGGYRAIGVTLPTTTTANKVIYVGCIYNSQDSFWDVVAVATQA